MTKDNNTDRRTLDIITHEVGLLEMADGHVTPDDRRWAESTAAAMHARIAEYRRSRLPTAAPPIKKGAALSRRAPREQLRSLDEPERASLHRQRVGCSAVGVA